MGPLQPDWRLRLIAIPLVALIGSILAWFYGILPLGTSVWIGGILILTVGIAVLTNRALPSLRYALFVLTVVLCALGMYLGTQHLHDFRRPFFGAALLLYNPEAFDTV